MSVLPCANTERGPVAGVAPETLCPRPLARPRSLLMLSVEVERPAEVA